MKIKNFYKNNSVLLWALLAAGAGVGIWLIVRRAKFKNGAQSLFGSAAGTTSADAINAITQDNNVSQQIVSQATITKQKAAELAKQIKNAWGVVNDDEQAVFDAFAQINNASDLLLLVDAYGIVSGMFGSYDLYADCQRRMSKNEWMQIQNMLINKGIGAPK